MNKSKGFFQNLIKSFAPNSSRGQRQEDLEQLAAKEQKQFRFETLGAATRNFHETNKLGEGGFGPVFKGRLDDGREIAVKKLSQFSRQGKKEFMNEAKLLARMQHKNVVNLLGYCVHGQEKLLVYEYVANESLDKLLFKHGKRNILDWNRRHDIIMGMAKGLVYLHEDAHCCIIHRDIKASNILLDDKWVPKIADFGMARLFSEDQSYVNTRVAGTNGYMAPEYVMHGRLSTKADVFSFGVVVLELLSGQKNATFNQDDCPNLLEWAYKLYKKGKSLDIMDPSVVPSAIPDQVAVCIRIGLLCVQSEPQLRPSMRRVVMMLSRKPGTLDEPTRPGYPGSRHRRTRRTKALFSPGTSRESSHSFGSTSNTNTATATSTSTVTATATATAATTATATSTARATTSAVRSPRPDPHGKRPVEYYPHS